MAEHPVQYNSLKILYLWLIIGSILIPIMGFILSQGNLPISDLDLLFHFVLYLGIPFLITIIEFYLGWNFKRRNLDYNSPNWSFEPTQLKIETVKDLPKKYNRQFSRLVAVPNFWYYFLPIIWIIFLFALPLYSFYINSAFINWIPFIYAISLGFLHVYTLWASWRSTSCKASGDFTLPLIREAVNLAEIQARIKGISHVRILLDKAESSGYEIYRSPRVVARVEGMEERAYIETSTEELGSVNRVLVRIYENGEFPEIIWWWTNRDRNFRKYVGKDEEGYYVKLPVPSRIEELGVKDVKLVIENAVSLLLLEHLRLHGPNESHSLLLQELGIPT